ncbi:hypothetical protein L596_015066 [Steinernema carpocapsae]|uniref:Uncharacterized protein n=1 Tax=Steinernema carpocapsae TaxID=34508 RepID=A0A4U5NE33_STECR|nr:hypothetical protein L596_015066 [Steinernema carpocapsae]
MNRTGSRTREVDAGKKTIPHRYVIMEMSAAPSKSAIMHERRRTKRSWGDGIRPRRRAWMWRRTVREYKEDCISDCRRSNSWKWRGNEERMQRGQVRASGAARTFSKELATMKPGH